MRYFFNTLLVVILMLASCKKEIKIEVVNTEIDSTKIDSERIVNQIGETLIPSAKRSVKDWKEYQEIDDFIIKYYNISKYEALNNAKELSELATYLRDSIRVEKLNKPNVIARLNVFKNETLRLADMAEITAISNKDVKNEVSQMLELFSALNSKINTIYKAEELQESLEVDTEKPIKIEVEDLKPKEVGRIPRVSTKKN